VPSTPVPRPNRQGIRQKRALRRSRLRRRVLLPLAVLLLASAAVIVVIILGSQMEGSEVRADQTAGVAETSPSSSSPTVTQTGAAVTETSLAALEVAAAVKANEMGFIPVLMYHVIRQDIISSQRLREDIALLKKAGFYPTTIREMAEGRMDIPAGKSPVVLSFDDSSPTHYRILDDGSLDPDCAVAILEAAVDAGDWASKATFFPLLYVDPPANIVFGQPAYAEQKLKNLVMWGYEVGSHTVTHQDLSVATPERIRKELAQSKTRLESMIGGGYTVYTLSPPFGEYPNDESLLAADQYEGVAYRYSAAVMAWGFIGRGSTGPSPFSSSFDPMRIPRISAYPKNTVKNLVDYFKRHPEVRFISDGDPNTISVPKSLPAEVGSLRTDLQQRVVRY